MANRAEGHSLAAAYEALLAHALDGAGEALRIPVEQASKIERAKYLGAQPYECNAARLDYADGIEPKMRLVSALPTEFEEERMTSKIHIAMNPRNLTSSKSIRTPSL